MSNKHTHWSSRTAFIIATTGAAVGLGNIWRFPYIAGQNGGGAFVLVYVLCVIAIGIPLMLAEMVIGKRAQTNPIDSLKALAKENGHTQHWKWVGVLGLIALTIILSFYSVIGGFSLYYLLHGLMGSFNHADSHTIMAVWHNLVSNPLQLILWHTVFMGITMLVISAGVVNGLERATKIMMPALYIILFILVSYSASIGHFYEAVRYLFHPNWHAITLHVVINAMGHAFFTLALGAGALLTYASYTKPKSTLLSPIIPVVILDILVAFLSGLAIFPLVFAFHLPLTSGPGLMYQALPIAFSHIHFGQWVGVLFFMLLLFSAWTSSINLAEPMIATMAQRRLTSRRKAAWCVGLTAWLLGLLSIFSFNVWSGFSWHHLSVFDLITTASTDYLLPIGGLGFALFAGWVMTPDTLKKGICKSPTVFKVWLWLTRIIAPIAIVLILLFATT